MNIYSWFVRGEHHAAMCRTSIASVRRADPEACCVVTTDEDSPKWRVDAIRLHCEGGPIMLANLDAQVNTMEYAMVQKAKKVTFLDTDIIFLKPFPMVGEIDFTWRDAVGETDDGEKVEGVADRMPYNYGVVCARPYFAAVECFIWMRERVRVMHPSHQQWYGNQLAAVELAGPRPDHGTHSVLRQIPWRLVSQGRSVNIGQLPCSLYNYTPQKEAEDTTKRFVLHFKGHKRRLMARYAHAMGLPWELPEEEAEALGKVNIV